MDWTKATNQQLFNIANEDKDCPTHLLSGVVEEMIKRNLWKGVILYSAKKVYHNLAYVLEYVLRIDDEELIHIGNIEICKRLKDFKPGMRTLKTFIILALKSKFIKLRRDLEAKKREGENKTKSINSFPVYIQDKLFHNTANVEQEVINKIMIENGIKVLNEKEKQAIYLDLMGYELVEIALMLGYKYKNSGWKLVNTAYKKLRKVMVA